MSFQIWPPHGPPGSIRCPLRRSGSPYASSRTSFAEQKLLGTPFGVIYILWVFKSDPHLGLQAQRGVPRIGLEALLLTLQHSLLTDFCYGSHKESITSDHVYIQPYIGLQAEKSVPKVDLETLKLTLERFLLNTCCWRYHKESCTLNEFPDLTACWGLAPRHIARVQLEALLFTLEHSLWKSFCYRYH